MSASMDWLEAFPLPQANAAVTVLSTAWTELAGVYRQHFNHTTPEPNLTLVLKTYIRDVVAPRMKLLGAWGAEDVGARIDYVTGKIVERFRTDIRYTWNDTTTNLDLIFEFKKLSRSEASRKHYYGDRGMLRFVTGQYSVGEPAALMAGILIDESERCVGALKAALQEPRVTAMLAMRRTPAGAWLYEPSNIFPAMALFDTDHTKSEGSIKGIRISHLFLPFGYPESEKPASN